MDDFVLVITSIRILLPVSISCFLIAIAIGRKGLVYCFGPHKGDIHRSIRDFKLLIFIYLLIVIGNKVVIHACSAAIADTSHNLPPIALSYETISSLVF